MVLGDLPPMPYGGKGHLNPKEVVTDRLRTARLEELKTMTVQALTFRVSWMALVRRY